MDEEGNTYSLPRDPSHVSPGDIISGGGPAIDALGIFVSVSAGLAAKKYSNALNEIFFHR